VLGAERGESKLAHASKASETKRREEGIGAEGKGEGSG